MKKLVIFGVGLIGGSVALALKKAGSDTHIVGVGRSTESLDKALKLGVIDEKVDAQDFPNETQANIHAAPSLSKSISDADLVLIAAPVAQTGAILHSIKPHLGKDTVITDAGSTKGDVLAAAQNILGAQFSQFVGAHPIAGAEKSGVSAAKADLFIGKNVVLTPTPETNIHGVRRATELWQACGAKVSEMTAETHDSIFAAVSHLPHLLAFALVDDIAKRPNAAQLFSFAASGFRDFTRIAGSSPEMWRDISLANKTALLSEINAFEAELSQLKQLLANENGVGLRALFEHASKARNDWAEAKK